MYFLLGICVILAFLLMLNVLASVSASLLWRLVSKRIKQLTSRKQAEIIFALRTFPVAAAVFFVMVFVLPAYLLFEPEDSGETVSVQLALIAFVCLTGVGIASLRVCRGLSLTRKLTKSWLANSQQADLEGVNIPVFRMKHPFPVMAVVGTLRPQMFIAEQIFDLLSPGELRAAIVHEYGHVHARDNFKRACMRICRDMLVFPVGRPLERAWADNIEAAADEHVAAAGGNIAALDLAEALIKLARNVPANSRPAVPLGSFVMGTGEADIRFRVRRLLEFSDGRPALGKTKSRSRLRWFAFGSVMAILLGLASNKALLLAVHGVSETVVAAFQ